MAGPGRARLGNQGNALPARADAYTIGNQARWKLPVTRGSARFAACAMHSLTETKPERTQARGPAQTGTRADRRSA